MRFNANHPDLQDWLRDCGYTVSIQNLSSWWASNRPRGKEAIAINTLSETYLGTDANGLLQMLAAITQLTAPKILFITFCHHQMLPRYSALTLTEAEPIGYKQRLL